MILQSIWISWNVLYRTREDHHHRHRSDSRYHPYSRRNMICCLRCFTFVASWLLYPRDDYHTTTNIKSNGFILFALSILYNNLGTVFIAGGGIDNSVDLTFLIKSIVDLSLLLYRNVVRFPWRRDTKTATLTISSPSSIHIPAVPDLLTSSTVIGCFFPSSIDGCTTGTTTNDGDYLYFVVVVAFFLFVCFVFGCMSLIPVVYHRRMGTAMMMMMMMIRDLL